MHPTSIATADGITKVLAVIGGKWRINIIWCIGRKGSIRYNELKRQVTGISNTVLTRSLEDLASHQLIERIDYHESPPRVEYRLSVDGLSLFPLIEQLDCWGTATCAKNDANEQY
ncbi:winged helix-turn-helix transcriptional regulator [Brochothrix campestris]|uniref:HTH hxlR-type domain-containing protein n=1 Tax=Brochothrix campestris FSL F6-1037 TaxID=1265861 RepID=W7CZP1_9LIST|nr:helix-turn-helix domain-containing protein [Brochothrix campestris]EUJ42235.1 hypothetical protein BCAMP_00560 [Brochothrix campestris FSL F6-1037]